MTDTDVLQIDYAPPLPVWSRRVVRQSASILLSLIVVGGAVAHWAPAAWAHQKLLSEYRRCQHYVATPDRVVYGQGFGSCGGNEYITPWDRFYAAYSPPGRQTGPVLFLHERTNSRGEHRLVVVEGWPVNGRGFAVSASVLRQSSRLATPQMITPASLHLLPTLSEISGERLRLYAGQPDPMEPSHFTIRYEVNGTPGTLDGWLRDDDGVTLLRREPPPHQ